MYLNEFDLDLPYVADEDKIKLIMDDKECQYQDATKYDYELNWKGKRCSFRLETRCITAMFERLFGKMKTSDCRKILVECIGNVTEERVMNFSNVITVQVKFKSDDFFSKSEIEKKKITLNLLMEGIEKISKNKDWDIEPFNKIVSQIKQADYINEWNWKKPVKSPSKNLYAQVLCQHKVESMDISLIIIKENGVELQRSQIILEYPDDLDFFKVIQVILVKTRTLLHCIYSLALDGHGQEAGTVLRIIIEAYDLLIYLRDDTSRVEQVLNDKIPSAGKIAKMNKSSAHELKNYLSNNASHLRLSFDSIRHLTKVEKSSITINIDGGFTKKAFISNISLVLAYIFFISSAALDCLKLKK